MPIKSVKKATDILFLLSDQNMKPVQLHQISEAVGVNKSTCSHILKTLCNDLLVQRVSRKEGYRLGPNIFYLTRYGRFQQELVSLSHPVLKWLNEQIHETVLLTVVCEGVKFIIHRIESNEKIDDQKSTLVRSTNICPTATGRLLMAYMSKEEQNKILEKGIGIGMPLFPEESVEDIKKSLVQIRKNGYVTLKTTFNNQRRLSYAFHLTDGKNSLGALGVTLSEDKYTYKLNNLIIKKSSIAANEINRRIRFGKSGGKNKNKKPVAK